jgi:hypothetical protein
LFASRSAQALSSEFDAMGVVNEAVEDGVGVSGVADHVMPCGQGKLRGDDRGPAAVSLLEDFEEVMTGAGFEGLEAEVVEDKEIGPAEGLDETRMPAVASSERQILTELGPAMIEDGTVVAAGFLADGAGKPAFADAARGSDILPGIRRLRGASSIHFTPGTV